jgi:alkaline phosphatase D
MSFRRLKQAEQLLADRRQFLLSGASLAVLPWLGSIAVGALQSNPSFASDPFTLGVASGEPAADGVVLWTRLAPKPTEGGGLPLETFDVAWEVASDDAMKNIVQKGKSLATPQLGHTVHVEVQGLEPDRPYWYRFSSGDAQTKIARTRTAPAADATPEKLKFAFASCQHWEAGLFTAYEHMAKEDLDLVMHLGDYIYENGGREGSPRRHTEGEIMSLTDYRNRHAQYKTDAHLQAMHALCPWLVVWDDHEVDNNYAGDFSEKLDVTREQLLTRRANGYQAYYEHMPLRKESIPFGPDMQLYRRVPFGRLVDFTMLDTRQYRSDQPNGDGFKPAEGAVLDPKTTMLGDTQERWLMNTLLRSPALWNAMGQQVIIARIDGEPGPDKKFSMDKWASSDVATKRLMNFFAERQIPNPVVLTGDIHSNWVNDLKTDYDHPEGPTVGTEFVGTSISSGGNGSQTHERSGIIAAENPHVKFHNAERGYVSCTVTPKEWRSDYRVIEYVDKPGAPLITRRSFVVENGQAGAKDA